MTDYIAYQECNVSLIVCRCQVKSCIIAHIRCIDAHTTAYQHLDNVIPAHHGCPMQQAKSMFIPAKYKHTTFRTFNSSMDKTVI